MSELSNKRRIPSRAFNLVASAGTPSRNTSIAWKPTFTGDKVTFSPGTVNGILPSNMFEEFNVSSGKERQYVLLKVTGDGENGVTDVTIELTNDPKVENKYEKNLPPEEFTFVLGVLNNGSYSMTASGPIGLLPAVAYVEMKKDPEVGQSPYNYFYTWLVS